VRENDVGQVFVANLTSIPIDSVEEFAAIYSCVLFSTYIFRSGTKSACIQPSIKAPLSGRYKS
jgi:hypothetical protein